MPLRKSTAPIRRFDLRDELRETAHRRKQAKDLTSAKLVSGSSTEVAQRLAAMFPSFPEDTVQAVLAELLRVDSSCSSEQLEARGLKALLEMGLSCGEPQAISSFEPPSSFEDSESDETPLPIEPELDGHIGADTSQALSGDNICQEKSQAEDEGFDQLLDSYLAALVAMTTHDLTSCVQTLVAILERIAAMPGDIRVRRLRCANAAFAQKVGRHEAAVDLLRLAGFEEDAGDADAAYVFHHDPDSFMPFCRVLEALRNVSEDLACGGVPSPSSSSADASASQGIVSKGFVEPRSTAVTRREFIAELTEHRLKDPRGFRERARASGSANNGICRVFAPPAHPGGSTVAAVPSRRSQHFTLSDIERMRIGDEIANMPSYAEEYRRDKQSDPVHTYSEVVARSYDPELIARQALDNTNRYRASKGLSPLRWHDGIARIASDHARSMASGQAPFSHDGFDQRVNAFPVAHRAAAENLALNGGVAEVARTAVDGWIKSPGHEKNLSGAFNLCGIGVARSATGTFYLTQLFASAL